MLFCRFQHGFRQELSPFFNNGFFRPPFPGFPTPLPTAALQATQAAAANQLALQHSQGLYFIIVVALLLIVLSGLPCVQP